MNYITLIMKSSKKGLISFVILSIVFSSLVFFSLPVKADESLLGMQVGLSDVGNVYGEDSAPKDPRLVVIELFKVVLGFLSLLVLGLVLFSGFQWMTSGGDEKKVADAKKRLVNAVIGLIILFSSWILTRYLIVVIGQTTSGKVDFTHY